MSAQSYRVVIGEIPGVEPLIELMKAMSEATTVKIDIQSVPMARMVNMVLTKQADCGMPMIVHKDQNKIKQLPFDYSTTNFQNIVFVLYSNKSKSIDIAEIKNGNKKNYQIESDITNADLFPFKIITSTDVVGSLKKVNEGRADGYLMGQISTDPLLKALQLKKIKRQLYESFDVVWVLQKGAKGSAIDNFLTEGLKMLKKSGKFNLIMGESIKAGGTYDNWQP